MRAAMLQASHRKQLAAQIEILAVPVLSTARRGKTSILFHFG